MPTTKLATIEVCTTTRQDTVVTLTINKHATIEVYTFICCMHISHSSIHALVFGNCISSACLVFFNFHLPLGRYWKTAGDFDVLGGICTVESKMAAICLCRTDAVTTVREGLYIQISLNWAARVISPGIPHGRCSHWCHTVVQVTRPFHSLNASFLLRLQNRSQRCSYPGAESRFSYMHRTAITSVIARVTGSLSAHVPLHHGCNITAKPKLKFE